MLTTVTFNLGECVLWIVVALLLLGKSLGAKARVKRTLRFLSVAFLLFGVSDFIEAHTGAWWTPIWLLFLKGACIAAFVFGFRNFFRLTKRETGP